MRLTNTLLVEVTNYLNYAGESNVVLSSGLGVFQTVGAGNGIWRTTALPGHRHHDHFAGNADSHLSAAGADQFHHTDTVLSPQAGRDTDLPDLRAHYYPTDFVVHNVIVTNATLLLTNGVAVATFGDTGFRLLNGSRVLSVASALLRGAGAFHELGRRPGVIRHHVQSRPGRLARAGPNGFRTSRPIKSKVYPVTCDASVADGAGVMIGVI